MKLPASLTVENRIINVQGYPVRIDSDVTDGNNLSVTWLILAAPVR
jgi:hypothetical protein